MGQCLVEGCGAYALSGDICAVCANTQPVKKLTKAKHIAHEMAVAAAKSAAANANPNAQVVLMCAGNATKPHEKFAQACQDYEDRFYALLSNGPHEGQTENINKCQVFHQTQKAGNRTVFYDWQGDNLRIFGVGGHSGGDGAGNNSYEMVWFDGKNKKYTR